MKYNNKSDKIATWVFIIPTIVFLCVTALFPLLYSLYLSFFKLKINLPHQQIEFVGFANYIRAFTDKLCQISTWNTVMFALISVSLELILGLAIAMAICSDKTWAKIITAIFMIPMIMAPVAAGTVWRMMLDSSTGVISYLLSFAGIPPISWLSGPTTAKIAVIFVNVWQLTPWVTVICVAALKSLPLDCLCSAVIDGATPFQVFRHIILPLIMPVLVIVMMIRFIDAFKVFDTVYVMTGGGPGTATEMLPNFIYRQGLKFFDAGYAAALAIVFVIGMSLCTIFFLKWRKREEDISW